MSPIDPSLRIVAVNLSVADLDASTDFYSRVLGLTLLESDGRRSLLGAGAEPALELTALERPAAIPAGSTGLFHVAWLHPSRAALAETVRRIGQAGWPFDGASDHAVSEALYLSDPDGLGIEVYADRPRETWQQGPDGQRVRMVTLALDVEDLLAQSPNEPGPAMPADVARAERFYRELGFEQQARLPAAAFVSAGGYHHHVGLNSWQSAGGSPAGVDAPGLAAVDFALDGGGALEGLAGAAQALPGVERRDGALTMRDPDGHELRFNGS
jgi:catechol 2,3-dioxygenase